MEEMCKKLKELRDKNGYTQEQVANYLNVDQSMIAKIENGTRNIGVSELSKLASLYGCELGVLLGEGECNPLSLAYRATNVQKEDLEAIAAIKKVALNLRFMKKVLNG